MPQYEYAFVRLGEGMFSVRSEAAKTYREVIMRRAGEGWRLVQVFAPPIGMYGNARFYELIFERPATAEAPTTSAP